MKTKIQIIDETVDYYSKNHRGKSLDHLIAGCYYRTPEGHMCAVGRCLLKKHISSRSIITFGDSNDLFDGLGEPDLILKKNYHGHSRNFWQALQKFHDTDSNWQRNSKGGSNLTPSGEEMLAILKMNYADK